MLAAEVEALKILVKSPISSVSQVTHSTTATPQRTGTPTNRLSRFLGNKRKFTHHLRILRTSDCFSFPLFRCITAL